MQMFVVITVVILTLHKQWVSWTFTSAPGVVGTFQSRHK